MTQMTPPQKKNRGNKKLSVEFKQYAACTCAGLGGILLGHLGCIITPLVIASTSATLALSASTSIIALGISLTTTASGVYLWNRLRGTSAGTIEKRLVFGSAICGAMLSIGIHFNHHAQHDRGLDIKNKTPLFCPPPPSIKNQSTLRI